MPFLDNLPPQGQFIAGIVLMVLGVSFIYKAYLAMVKGRLKYWDGFLPFTIVSPFILHLPTSKRSLVKETEGLWVHFIFGPIFMFTAVLCICAGADIAYLPGTATLNLVLNGGKAGADKITFDRHYGYKFPILAKAGPVFAKLFASQAGLQNKEKLYENNGSLGDAMK
jgi:hypothetical protein